MKIALALSGLPRIYPIATASWGRIIGQYSVDVYVHSWYTGDMNEDYIRDQLGWVFKPSALSVELAPEIDVSPYPDRHWPYINVDRSLSMWHSIKKANDIIKQSNIDYDLIVRGRMDWHVHRLDIIYFNGITLPWDNDKVPLRFLYRGVEMHGFNDHFAYGPPEYMDKYVSTLDQIPILYRDEAVDYCPENFLAANLVKQNVPVMLQHIEHCLIRS